MQSSKPPMLATWLLRHFFSDSAPLLGDCIEEYRHGRSRFWYWRQALTAIAAFTWKEVRHHRTLAVRGMVVGWLVWVAYQAFCRPLLYKSLLPLGATVPFAFGLAIPPSGFGWWAIWLAVRAASGWLVARLHRPYEKSFVLLFAISVLVWKLQGLPDAFSSAVGSANDFQRIPYLAASLMGIFLPPIAVLVGGFWGTGKRVSDSAHAVPTCS